MLTPDERFPEVDLTLSTGEVLSLPSATTGRWAYLLFYRGGW